jgi:hypothetical protein
MQNAMLDKLAAIPGVTSVSLAATAPLKDSPTTTFCSLKIRPMPSGRSLPSAGFVQSRQATLRR